MTCSAHQAKTVFRRSCASMRRSNASPGHDPGRPKEPITSGSAFSSANLARSRTSQGRRIRRWVYVASEDARCSGWSGRPSLLFHSFNALQKGLSDRRNRLGDLRGRYLIFGQAPRKKAPNRECKGPSAFRTCPDPRQQSDDDWFTARATGAWPRQSALFHQAFVQGEGIASFTPTAHFSTQANEAFGLRCRHPRGAGAAFHQLLATHHLAAPLLIRCASSASSPVSWRCTSPRGSLGPCVAGQQFVEQPLEHRRLAAGQRMQGIQVVETGGPSVLATGSASMVTGSSVGGEAQGQQWRSSRDIEADGLDLALRSFQPDAALDLLRLASAVRPMMTTASPFSRSSWRIERAGRSCSSAACGKSVMTMSNGCPCHRLRSARRSPLPSTPRPRKLSCWMEDRRLTA